MKINYKTPITDENIEKVSYKIERAANNIRLANILNNVLSPVCAIINILAVPTVTIYLLQILGKEQFLENAEKIPYISLFYYYARVFLNSIKPFGLNDFILMGALLLALPIVFCCILALLIRLICHKSNRCPFRNEKNVNTRAKLLCEQVKKLTLLKVKSTKNICVIIATVVLVLLGVTYLILGKKVTAGMLSHMSTKVVVIGVGFVGYCFLSYLTAVISKKIISIMCLLNPKYDTHKLARDAVDYRLSLDINSIVSEGIKNRKFYMVYQPVFWINDNAFNSAEALARLNSPIYGNIPPSMFIPCAEKTGEISALTDQIVDMVCAFISKQGFDSLGIKYININLSVVDCSDKQRIKDIIARVDSFGVAHNKINFEITESAAVNDDDTFWGNINLLSKEGFVISMDDFGTGYSSLSRMISDAFNVVKLDKSLLADRSAGNKHTLLVDLVNMLKHLDKKILMEGVETKEQVELIKSLGIDYIQGFYYSKPISDDNFIKFVNEHK